MRKNTTFAHCIVHNYREKNKRLNFRPQMILAGKDFQDSDSPSSTAERSPFPKGKAYPPALAISPALQCGLTHTKTPIVTMCRWAFSCLFILFVVIVQKEKQVAELNAMRCKPNHTKHYCVENKNCSKKRYAVKNIEKRHSNAEKPSKN